MGTSFFVTDVTQSAHLQATRTRKNVAKKFAFLSTQGARFVVGCVHG